MKKYIISLIFPVLFILNSHAALPEETVDRLADAIYKIENSKKYPYGIVSIKLKGDTQAEREAYARKICRRTIINTEIRWQKAGRPNKYMEFLQQRYAPQGVANDPSNLNANWLKNLRKISGLDI